MPFLRIILLISFEISKKNSIIIMQRKIINQGGNMEINRDVQNRKLYIVDNDEILLQTGKLGADFVIHFHTKDKVVITKELDEFLYLNLKQILKNNYFFGNDPLSYQTDNKIVWFSDCYCNIEDEEERSRISRLIIEYIDNSIELSYENQFYENYNINRDGVIAFSPAGNGFYSRNKKTGLTFQDDIVWAFYQTLVKEYVKTKKKVRKK